MIEPPRSLEQRTADVLARLRGDVDLWVASADADGAAYLVPLSFVWDGAAVTFATPRSSRTARNLVRAGSARVALGLTRDVVMLDGVVEAIAIGTDPALEEAHAAATGFDPRAEPEEYVYLRITPREIQAWREANELSGRKVMRAGRWLAEAQAPPDVP
jgi:nitroimidazol reductase NimA-like FMN-containing flavoprotein (pyridoxamine 5'-phosphate oxidase superfamily)